MDRFFNIERLLLCGFYLLVFLLSVFLTSGQLSGVGYPSDFIVHLSIVPRYFEGELSYLPHPLWHIVVHAITQITIDAKMAASITTGFFVLLWTYILHALVTDQRVLKSPAQCYGLKTLSIVAILLLIGPAYIPIFNEYILLGQGSPNMWHNPTLIAVKPFALLTVIFTLMALQQPNRKFMGLAVILFTVSLFAKPSFAIVFIPALVIYLVLTRYRNITGLVFIGVMCSVFIGIAAYQYLHFFGQGSGASSVIIDFLGVWSGITPNVFVSVLLGLCFPLLLLLFAPKICLADTFIGFAWIMQLVALAVFAILAEGGPHYKDGNFAWSYVLAMSLLYVFSVISYFKHWSLIHGYRKWLLNIILCYQVGVGVYYLSTLLKGGSFL